MKKNLIAVYGSLRQGHGNHRLIEHTEYVGTFKTEPVFNLYSLGGYPGLKENGDTAVVMEVYSVDDDTARRVDGLEGYVPGRPATFYDKIPLETPFGTASVYTYVNNISEDRKVHSGDWNGYRGVPSRESLEVVTESGGGTI